jgi:hypothetical protein
MPSQRYVSKELTHFVGRGMSDEAAQYVLLIRILSGGWLSHAPHDPDIVGNIGVNKGATLSSNELYAPQVICFCDIPLDDLEIHTKKYSQFGIAFSKAWLVTRGATPVFYVARDALVSNVFMAGLEDAPELPEDFPAYLERIRASRKGIGLLFDETNERAERIMQPLGQIIARLPRPEGRRELSDLGSVFQFLSFVVFGNLKFFDCNLDDSDNENYYMEREWRVLGHLKFALDDVVRILLPKDFGPRLRKDLPSYGGQVHFLE